MRVCLQALSIILFALVPDLAPYLNRLPCINVSSRNNCPNVFAEYISPAYEKLGFDLCRDHLVSMGYPQDIREFEYDPSFALRCHAFDRPKVEY